MIRPVAAFAILFAGGMACVSLLPNPPKTSTPRSAAAGQPLTQAGPAATAQKVRVVYPAPGSGADATQLVRTVSTDAAPATASVADAQPAIYPQAQGVTPSVPATVVPPNAAVPTGVQGLNLNTASIDALNQIPGAGHIGRTIASHRPYRSVEDLLAKRVIRKSVYDRIKDQVAAE